MQTQFPTANVKKTETRSIICIPCGYYERIVYALEKAKLDFEDPKKEEIINLS